MANSLAAIAINLATSGSSYKRKKQYETKYYFGLAARKPVFGVSDQSMFKPTCSAQETRYNDEIMYEVNKISYFDKANNKGTDQTVQMCKLVCPFVNMQQSQKFSRCSPHGSKLEIK